MATRKNILKKQYRPQNWLHKKLLFKNDTEFAMLLLWAMFVSLLLYSIS